VARRVRVRGVARAAFAGRQAPGMLALAHARRRARVNGALQLVAVPNSSSCPYCQYQWAGLSIEGVCPECGLVRAEIRATERFHSHGCLLLNAVLGVALLVLLAWTGVRAGFNYNDVYLYLVIGSCAAVCWFRFIRLRRDCHVVFCDEYVALRSSAWLAWRQFSLLRCQSIIVDARQGLSFVAEDGAVLLAVPMSDVGGADIAKDIVAAIVRWHEKRCAGFQLRVMGV